MNVYGTTITETSGAAPVNDLERAIDEFLELTEPLGAQQFDFVKFCKEFTAGHVPQFGFMTDTAPFEHVMCARQTGKSWGDDGILYGNAQQHPRSMGLLLGIKGTGVKINNWVPIWKQGVCERYGVPDSCHNETLMMTTFQNGARVMFAGTDDLSNVKKYLGNRLHNSVVIIDEVQDQPPAIVKYILTVLLPPMLTPTSRVILSGVLPDLPVGLFLDLAAYDPESKTGGKGHGYSHHEWARAENIHTPEAMEQLHAYLKLHNISIDEPQIQRDWFKKRVWDPSATAYRYQPHRNGYEPEVPLWLRDLYAAKEQKFADTPLMYCHPMREDVDDGARFGLMAAVPRPGVKYFSFALDPGATADRASVEGVGWGEDSRDVQHVFEWATPRGKNMTTGQMFAVMGLAQKHFTAAAGPRGGIISWRYDTTSKNTIDNLQKDYGIPVVQAAKKTDLLGQVDRNNTLLEEGRFLVMLGSALEQDYQRARWDADARARGQRAWARAWHPDPSEAARYALQDYFDAHIPPTPEPANDLERHRAEVRAMLEEAKRRDEEAEEDGMGGLG